MTWQEELRQLDSALAGGDLAANEYRKRRDEILAAASSAQPPSAIIGPPTGPQPVVAPEGDNAEVTQVVDAQETELVTDADKTQVISKIPGDAESTQVVNSSERTQTINPAPPVQQGWTARPPDPAVSFGLPRQQTMPAPVTPNDAQNLFGNARPRSRGKGWLIAAATVVVLAVGAGAIWYFGFNEDETPAAGPTTENTTTAPPPLVNVADIELPGEPATNNGEMDIAAARTAGVLAEQEAILLEEAGITVVEYSGSTEGAYRFLLYSYPSSDDTGAVETTEKVAAVQEQLGLQPAELTDVPEGVQVTQFGNEQAAVLRALYTHGDTTIQLCVLQVPIGGAEELQEQFRTALDAVTAAAPPAR